jgi:hypothetical protein
MGEINLDRLDPKSSMQLLDVLRERVNNFSASHTYPIFKKLQNDTNNPFFPYVGIELNNEIERIVKNEWMSARIVEEFDYGLGGLKNMLFYIPYNRHRIFFAIDVFNVVLVNYFTDNEVENYNKLSISDICLIGLNKPYVERIDYLGETFYATNTNKSFLNFGLALGENKREVSNNLNNLLWNDFKRYINNQECMGTHNILQIGNIIINCNFNKGVDVHFKFTSKLWVDVPIE